MEKLLTIGQVAKQLNVTVKTLRLWDEEGKLVAVRTPGRHRRYRESHIEKFISIFIEIDTPRSKDTGSVNM